MSLSFYDIFNFKDNKWHHDISPIFNHLFFSENIPLKENLNYFLEHMLEPEFKDLDAINKILLFSCLNMRQGQEKKFFDEHKKSYLNYYFNHDTFLYTFKTQPHLVIDFVNYFNTEINYYFQSHRFIENTVLSIENVLNYFKIYHQIDYSSKIQMGVQTEHPPFFCKIMSDEIQNTVGTQKIRAIMQTHSHFGNTLKINENMMDWLNAFDEKSLIEEKIGTIFLNQKTLKI